MTNKPIAEDFAAIAAEIKKLKAENDNTQLSMEPEKECEACEGGGWECYGTGHMDPHFRECSVCHNPEGHPSP
jgi:hypothetical protein